MNFLTDLGVLFLCYLMGAIPTGLLVARAAKGIDIRQHGSKNIGATNVWRVLGWKFGLTTFLIDVGKAFAAVLFVAGLLGTEALPYLPILGGVAVLLGNFFNIFLGFKGGKGVAASLGVFLALAAIPVLLAFTLFLVVVAVTRYISLGSILAAIALPILVAVFQGIDPLFYMMLVICGLVIFKHRANIGRLVKGTENKMGRKKS
jgi:acyl phosphate:glycerol-3-phosphate acyltransferase